MCLLLRLLQEPFCFNNALRGNINSYGVASHKRKRKQVASFPATCFQHVCVLFYCVPLENVWDKIVFACSEQLFKIGSSINMSFLHMLYNFKTLLIRAAFQQKTA